jgi:hypothetical protein
VIFSEERVVKGKYAWMENNFVLSHWAGEKAAPPAL